MKVVRRGRLASARLSPRRVDKSLRANMKTASADRFASDGEVTESRDDIKSTPVPCETLRPLKFDQGLYSLTIGALPSAPSTLAGVVIPAVQILGAPSDDPIEILGSSREHGSWLGPEGGTVAIHSPAAGGYVLVTAYGSVKAAELEISIRRLDRPDTEPVVRDEGTPTPRLEISTAPSERTEAEPLVRDEDIPTPPRQITILVILHIERVGDRGFLGGGWVGYRGQNLRIEALSIRPIDTLGVSDVEYKALGPNGRETPWVSEGKLCGTRDGGLPLTGFAVRLAPHLRDRFAAIYQGSFLAGGIVGPVENGERCASTITDDPLEAINVRLVERTTM